MTKYDKVENDISSHLERGIWRGVVKINVDLFLNCYKTFSCTIAVHRRVARLNMTKLGKYLPDARGGLL